MRQGTKSVLYVEDNDDDNNNDVAVVVVIVAINRWPAGSRGIGCEEAT